MITADTIPWAQIASFIVFVLALFGLYRLLVEKKDAVIQLQKENIAFLKDQLAEAKLQSPDLLALSLAGRLKLLDEELKRVEQDKTATKEQVVAKEAEVLAARGEAEVLNKQVLHARELLKDFLCPHCGATLIEKAYQSEMVEYEGREFDVDHDQTVFECGLEIVDGQERRPCKVAAARHKTSIAS